MSRSFRLPDELWNALKEKPDHSLTFEQDGWVINLTMQERTEEAFRLAPLTPPPSTSLPSPQTEVPLLVPIETAPEPAQNNRFTPAPRSKMKLELLDESDPQLRPAALVVPLPETPPPQTPPTKRPVSDALRTHDGLPQPIPVDIKGIVSSDNLNAVANTDTPPPPEEDLQPTSPTSSESLDTIEGKAVFVNAFTEDDDDGWLSASDQTFRALRTTDTPQVLTCLFNRMDTQLEHLDRLLGQEHSGLAPSHLAKASGITSVLPEPVPFTTSPDTPPTYHLVGEARGQHFVLLYKDQETGELRFEPIPQDGGTYQIALVEGEELLTDDELTKLFKEGARDATPEQAEATAKQVKKKLRKFPTNSAQKAVVMKKPATLQQQQRSQGLSKAIPVNQRLLKRLDYNRSDQPHLWDDNLQPGISVFRYNIATIYKDQQPIMEGVLLCIVARKQYLVYDRRSKRSLPLDPAGEQQIWLRHDDRLL